MRSKVVSDMTAIPRHSSSFHSHVVFFFAIQMMSASDHRMFRVFLEVRSLSNDSANGQWTSYSPNVVLLPHLFYAMNTEAFDFVLGTNFFTEQSQVLSLTLQVPCVLHVDHGRGKEFIPPEHTGQLCHYQGVCKKEPAAVMFATKMENYQLVGDVLDHSLKGLGYSRADLTVELFASDKRHVLDLNCSKRKNSSYKFYSSALGLAYGNPRLSDLGKVLTKVALECSRMVLCSPHWGAHGENEYWRTLLEKLTLISIQLPDADIYVPLGKKTPLGKPRCGSMLSVMDGTLAPVPWEELDPTLAQETQDENRSYTLDVLRTRARPQDAVETTLGDDDYVVRDPPTSSTPSEPADVPNPDDVSECGLSELPSSIHSHDESHHHTFFVQVCLDEVDYNGETADKPLFSIQKKETPRDSQETRAKQKEYLDWTRRGELWQRD